MTIIRTVLLTSLLVKYQVNNEVYLFVPEKDDRSDEEIIRVVTQ